MSLNPIKSSANIYTWFPMLKSTMGFEVSGKQRRFSRLRFQILTVLTVLFVSLVPVSSAIDQNSSPFSQSTSNNHPVKKLKINLREGFGSSPTDVKSPLHVAQCRATCLQKFNNREDGVKASSCFQQPDCFTCWRSCELLESSWNGSGTSGKDKVTGGPWKPICSQPRVCLNGCQQACHFYEILKRQSSESSASPAVVPTNNENVIHFSDGKIQWPRNPKEADILGLNHMNSLVYLIVQQYGDHKWRQIAQTPMSEVDIPRGLNSQQSHKLRSTRVLVVGPSGLVTMYSPQLLPKDVLGKETKGTTTVKTPVKVTTGTTITYDMTVKMTTENHEQEQEQTEVPKYLHQLPTSLTNNDVDWNLRKVSLIHQKFLVIAELTWNAIPGAKDYLITWELDGGGLKGHLVTDSTVVTLSLWPDTIYHIQVELCGEEDSKVEENLRKSFQLAVDTSEALFPMVQPSALSKTQSSHKSVTEFLNVTLLVTVSSFLFILLCLALGAFTWCRILGRRRSRELRLLQDMEEDSDPTLDTRSPKKNQKPKEGRPKNPNLSVAVISNQFIYPPNEPFLLRAPPPPPAWTNLMSNSNQHFQSVSLKS